MININNKEWDKLCSDDIKQFLEGEAEENFFFEFKNDKVKNNKLIEEISAFSNTYGGYIFLGVDDNKEISGCNDWKEDRIHTVIRDSITPIPNFDVKKFKIEDKVVLVIKIEEGEIPPYITNNGKILRRVSSGSYNSSNNSNKEKNNYEYINTSFELLQLYNKRKDQLEKIKSKIELLPIRLDKNITDNIFAYLDLGFSVVCSERTNLQKNFYKFDFIDIANYLREKNTDFSISQVGYSHVISIGSVTMTDNYGNNLFVNYNGLHNFIEIMDDGSVKSRIILTNEPTTSKVCIDSSFNLYDIFKKIYSMIFGAEFFKIFIYAHKYEKLTVLKQFTPIYSFDKDEKFLLQHREKYGNNLIIDGSRFPKNDYELIDRKSIGEYNNQNVIDKLLRVRHLCLGYMLQDTLDFFKKI